jgi:hypothetical protein
MHVPGQYCATVRNSATREIKTRARFAAGGSVLGKQSQSHQGYSHNKCQLECGRTQNTVPLKLCDTSVARAETLEGENVRRILAVGTPDVKK